VSQTIDDRPVGADWVLEFYVPIVDGVNVTSCRFVLKDHKELDDEAAIIDVTGVVSETAQPNSIATLRFDVPYTMTGFDVLEPDRRYWYRALMVSTDTEFDFREVAEDGYVIPR
jgi:hypothetical protein